MVKSLVRLWQAFLAWLGKAFVPAQDPRQTVAYSYERQRLLLAKVRQALVHLSASESRLARKSSELEARLPGYEALARQALSSGREDDARLELRRRHVTAAELQFLEQQLEEVRQEQRRLSLLEQRLATQLEAFQARQQAIAARYSAAEAQVEISRAVRGVYRDLSDLDQVLAQAERQTDRVEARADWLESLEEIGAHAPSPMDPADQLFGQLNMDLAVEAELAELKGEIGQA